MWFENGLDNPVSDFEDVQHHAVSIAQDGDIFVELGSFVGESAASMIEKIRASGKRIKLYCIDVFDIEKTYLDGNHSPDMVINGEGLTCQKWIDAHGLRGMYATFAKNLRYKDRDKLITGVLIGKSAELAELFTYGSVKFCFVDAGHSFDEVLADMRAWFPKMKPDGLFAGHDWFSGEQIRRAVLQFAEEQKLAVRTTHSSWILQRR